MKFRNKLLRVGIIGFLIASPLAAVVKVWAADVPGLVISQFKITSSNGQFVTLYNQSDSTIDLSQYEVDYVNSSNKLSSLPITGQLASQSFYMMSDDQVRLCYQMTIDSTSLGLATTSGKLQVWQVASDGSSKQLQDQVSWTNKANSTNPISLPTQNGGSTVSLLRQPTNAIGNLHLVSPGGGSWQAVAPDAANPCTLDIINTSTPVASPTNNPGNQLSVGEAPPSIIVSLASDDSGSGAAAPRMPVKDVGLAAPQVTELLPNPEGTGADDTDEFIELYNPNAVPFDLSGFVLETGLTTKHKYVIPDGTTLPAKGFKAFASADTGISLSNTNGEADLLDPFGNPISQSGQYGTAKDGLAWALAKGKWYWTSKPTPNAANVIVQAGSIRTASAKQAVAKVKGASTVTPALQGGTAVTDTASATDTPAPIHPYILAAVAALAVGYGVYEYRHDLGNKLHQFRANRAARRKARG